MTLLGQHAYSDADSYRDSTHAVHVCTKQHFTVVFVTLNADLGFQTRMAAWAQRAMVPTLQDAPKQSF